MPFCTGDVIVYARVCSVMMGVEPQNEFTLCKLLHHGMADDLFNSVIQTTTTTIIVIIIILELILVSFNSHLLEPSEICLFLPGANKTPLIGVSQKLKGLLPSSLEVKLPDDLLETLYRLLDLVSIIFNNCSCVIKK